MTADSENPLYKLGYSRGRKKTEQELAEMNARLGEAYAREQQAWDMFYAAALSQVLHPDANWQIAGEKIKTVAGYSSLAKQFADEGVRLRGRPR